MSIRFYQFGVDRMSDNWMGKGTPGTEFIDDDHLYSGDLDLFGPGSLFERLCIAHTESGRHTLAQWLCEPAPIDEIRRRQEAIRELCAGKHWREQIDFMQAAAKPIQTNALVKWSRQGCTRRTAWLRIMAPVLFLFTVLAVLGAGCSSGSALGRLSWHCWFRVGLPFCWPDESKCPGKSRSKI